MERYVPINKGNYADMETEERRAAFEANRGFGWEKEYKVYRAHWMEYPKRQYVGEYPLNLDIELSTICNLHCPMCYTITEMFQSRVNRQLMAPALFYKIIDEIAGKVPAVRLSLRGESTLHPNFVEFIRYCKRRGIPEVSFLTNCSTMSGGFFCKVAEAGADWITLSIDGMGETYERIRKPLKFEDTLQKVREIKRIKDDLGLKRPVIKIQSVWPAIRENAEEFYNTFVPYVDLIAFNPMIDFGANDRGVYEEGFVCPQLFQRMVIGSDGMALCCSNDENGMVVIGDANQESIYELWHGERRMEVLKAHKAGNYQQIGLCRECYLPRKTVVDEYGTINGRTFPIRNYVKGGGSSER